MTFISKTKTLTYRTKYRLQFINITQDIERFIQSCGVETGVLVIQTHHTTCSLWVNEDEKNLIGTETLEGDLKKVLDRFAHPAEEYGHNDVRDSRNPHGRRTTHLCEPDEHGIVHECINGHSHAQGMILQSSLSLIIDKRKLVKGRWQQILLVELDHNRERTVTFLVQGSKK